MVTTAKLSHVATRRVPIALKASVHAELNRLEMQQITIRMTEPSDRTSAMAVVHKANSDLRICIHPGELNKVLMKNTHPVPTIKELLPEVSNAKYFSKCDVGSGFWHVLLDQSSHLMTFATPFGRYH